MSIRDKAVAAVEMFALSYNVMDVISSFNATVNTTPPCVCVLIANQSVGLQHLPQFRHTVFLLTQFKSLNVSCSAAS